MLRSGFSHRAAQLALAASCVVALLTITAPTASAHTSFESSAPTDGDVVDEPVSLITVTFAGAATPTGAGFVVLDPTGVVRTPDSVESDDDLTWTLRFDEPLTGGTVVVRWEVAAPDAHPIDGSFRFTVNPPAPTTTTTVDIEATQPASGAPRVDTTDDRSAPAEASTTTAPRDAASTDSTTAAVEPVARVSVEEFLDAGGSSAAGADRVGDVGRSVSLVSAILAVGWLVFAALVLRGDASDIRTAVFWIRRAGIALTAGAAIQAIAHVAVVNSAWSALTSPPDILDALGSWFGLAVALRIVAGVLVAAGTSNETHEALTAQHESVPETASVAAVTRDAAVGHDTGHSAVNGQVVGSAPEYVWRPMSSTAAFVGLYLVLMSFLFDGHTVTEGPRWLHAAVNIAHVGAAATWAGGVAMIALIVQRRHRRGDTPQALQLAVRFSVVAAAALAVAGLAGVMLTILIIDSVDDVWSTSWGRLLMLKTALVAISASCGAYNHRVLIPALEHHTTEHVAQHRFRTVVTVEAGVLLGVSLVTAGLVAASAI